MPFLRLNLRSSLWFQNVKKQLPPINYITLHYLYFIMMCLFASIVFWLSGGGKERIEYTDCLFLVVSAMTEAGLNTVNLSEMSTAQQTILFVLIVIGSSIFISIATVLSRKWVIEARCKHFLKSRSSDDRRRSRNHSGLSMRLPVDDFNGDRTQLEMRKMAKEYGDMSEFESRHSEPRDPISGPEVGGGGGEGESVVVDQDRITHLRYAHGTPSPGAVGGGRGRVLSFAGVGAHPMSTSYRQAEVREGDSLRRRERGRSSEKEIEELDGAEYPNYLTRHTTGRNAQFFNLTREEREHLGGVEYRAIKLLGYVVPAYFLVWQIAGCTGLAAYFAYNKAMVTEANGINPWWLGYFNGVSAFNNSGMSLLDANMIPFQTAVYPLVQMGIMILAGNTAYPIFLRFILWSMLRIVSLVYPSGDRYAEFKATLRFILKYPRRVYTHLFPAPATRWLLFMVLCLNGIDWLAFELLNLHNPSVTSLPPGFRVLDGLFQALAVRSGGFYVIAIIDLRIGLQVLYVIMMYISVYPVVITMRHSNVYEERSLGIYSDDPQIIHSHLDPESRTGREKEKDSLASKLRSRFGAAANLHRRSSTGTQFIRQQISGQLTHDLWLLILAIFIISCIEGTNFETDPVAFSVFNIAFEVVSGYGCVGISTGTPMAAYSFSGTWHTGSKLVLVGVMLRGRHRGLPVALDRAVELPVGGLHGGVAEEEDWEVRRTFSRGGSGSGIVV